MKLKTILISIFAFIAVGVAGIGFVNVYVAEEVSYSIRCEEASNHQLDSCKRIFTRLERFVRLISDNTISRQTHIDEIIIAQTDLRNVVERLIQISEHEENNLDDDDREEEEDEAEQIEEIEESWTDLDELANAFLAERKSQQQDTVNLQAIRAEIENEEQEFRAILEELHVEEREELNQRREEINRVSAFGQKFILSASGIMIAVSAIAILFILRAVARPITALTQATCRLGQGNLDHRVVAQGPKELQELAIHFNQMSDNLQEQQKLILDSQQAAEQATKAKSEFLANMSHEIRTPMTAILGFNETLLDPELSSYDRHNAIQTVRRNGEYLLQIINDILDISKIESGMMEKHSVRFSPVEIIAEVQSLMRVRADSKNLDFTIEYIDAIPETIESDPTRLRQILVNLIGNAIKFTELGGVRVTIRMNASASNEPGLQFDINDTGIGLTSQQIEKLFNPFVQADTTTSRKFGGTGLGLAISKRLADLLGGDIIVESRPDVGSTFRVTIATGSLDNVRMIENPACAMIARPEQKQEDNPDSLNCRILLAEDGPDNQKLITHILKKAGAEVIVVENGRFAVEAAMLAWKPADDSYEPFDIILMDMQMPIMGGHEATRRLRDQGYPGTIIALTAEAMSGDREKCIQAGCDDYTTKPIIRNDLINMIRKHMSANPEHSDQLSNP